MKLTNAPIAEVVIGAQFDEPVISNTCIYEFYQEVKGAFPIIKENPVLPPVIESTEGKPKTRIVSGFHARKFFSNKKDSKLIQLQSDRLLFNWKKTIGDDEYPHFDAVYKEFKKIFDEVDRRCDIAKHINQLEVTYLDHIHVDKFGNSNYNPSKIFNLFQVEDAINIRHLKLEIDIPVIKLDSLIKIRISSATSNLDGSKLLLLETTCRGALGQLEIDDWFNYAHEELLICFKSIITDRAKEIWEVQE